MFPTGSLDTQFKLMSGNIFNMIIFDKFKTGDPIIDAIMTTIVLTFFTYLFQYFNGKIMDLIYILNDLKYDFKSWFNRKYIIEYDGKIALTTNFYDSRLNQTNSFSDRFKALWKHIIQNIGDNDSINFIKDYSFVNPSYCDEEKRDLGIYMVIQKNEFLISKKLGIYAYTYISSEVQENENKIQIGLPLNNPF